MIWSINIFKLYSANEYGNTKRPLNYNVCTVLLEPKNIILDFVRIDCGQFVFLDFRRGSELTIDDRLESAAVSAREIADKVENLSTTSERKKDECRLHECNRYIS